jgi:signal transduction histidine kinase
MTNSRDSAQAELSPLVLIASQQLLRILRRPDPRFLWKSLERSDYKLSEQLSKEILAAPYIDNLRSRIEKDRRYFTRIEETAAYASDYDAAVNYPYTIILLLSVMRKYLRKGTNLYNLARASYEYHKAQACRDDLNRDELRAAREIVVEMGIQIYRREGDLEKQEDIWPYLQLEFKYPEALFSRRLQFYQTDDPRKLFRLTTERWIKSPAGDTAYNTLEQKEMDFMGALHPQLLELPVPYGSADALRVVESISNSLREGGKRSFRREQNRDHLAKNLRIVQWDLFTRDLIVEQTERKLSYKSSLVGGVSGLPPDEFLDHVTEKSCKAHCHYFPLHSGILRERDQPKGDCKIAAVKSQLKEYRAGFVQLLSKAEKYNPTSYDDVIESFSYQDDTSSTTNPGSFSKAVLVEDGELSFFIILWLLRHTVNSGEDLQVWREDPSAQLTVDFCPTPEVGIYGAWWRRKDLLSFAQICGLIIPAHRDDYVILTRRWRSLIRWLRRQLRIIRADLNEWPRNRGLHDSLPIKKIGDAMKQNTSEHEFADTLQKVLTSKELYEYLSGTLVFPDEIPLKKFAEYHIGALIEIIRPLLDLSLDDASLPDEPNEPWPHRDNVLIRMSRAGFLPLEHLFRSYQPHELHLLLLALSFTKTELVDQKPAPVSLAFATIAGALLPGVALGMTENPASAARAKQIKEEDTARSRARRWLAPYWTLFTALSTELSIGEVQKASRQMGFEEVLNAFSHEVGKVEGYVFNNLFMKFGDVFAIEGDVDELDSQIALSSKWLTPAGEISPQGSDARISDWRVCPTPDLLSKLYTLYSVWMGSKVSLKDLGLSSHGYFSDLLNQLIPMAVEMAVARQMIEDINPIRSLAGAQRADTSTAEAVKEAPKIHIPKFYAPANRLHLNVDTYNDDPMRKMFLARALLAALSNAVQHTSSGREVHVRVSLEENNTKVVVEIENPAKPEGGDPQRAKDAVYRLLTKTKFGYGSEAVMQTCAKQLGGTAEIRKISGGRRYKSHIDFPLPAAGEDNIEPWITLKAK